MGQNRTDTAIQIAAKVRGAEQRRCPSCNRGNALSARMTFTEAEDGWKGSARVCRYCGCERITRWRADGTVETQVKKPRGD